MFFAVIHPVRWQDLFVHVYWTPAVFWGLAFGFGLLDICGTWVVGRAMRFSGPGGRHSRPWLSVRRRIRINALILATFPVLSVLRFYGQPAAALAWFLLSQFVIAAASVRPVLTRALGTLREARMPARSASCVARGLP